MRTGLFVVSMIFLLWGCAQKPTPPVEDKGDAGAEAAANADREAFRIALDAARKAHDEENFEGALTHLNEAITINSEDPKLVMFRGNVLSELDRNEEALQSFLKAEAMAESKNPWSAVQIAETHVKLNQKDEAFDWLEKAVEERDLIYAQVLEDEAFESLREESRYEPLIARIHEKVGIGKPAKDFSVELLDGSSFSLSEQKGKVVLLDFWATWCKPCVEEMPNVKDCYETFHDKGLEIIGVSLDRDRSDLEKFVEKQGLTWNMAFSGDAWKDATAADYHVASIPSMFLVDRKGVLRHFGMRGEALQEAVAELIAEN